MKKTIMLVFIFILCLVSGFVKAQSYDTLGYVKRVDSSSACGYRMERLFPNPYCAVYQCKFSVADTSVVKIILCDTNNIVIIKICDGVLKPGKYAFDLLPHFLKKSMETPSMHHFLVKLDAEKTGADRKWYKVKFNTEMLVLYL
ncbi:MAG: hypothetical protein PHN88_09640 [Ignavibacteria bacterium]|nr:hypothetical protein [Ignavibacteria bacterium]